MLEQLSVVIPTFNRPNFIMRQLKYWENTGVQIIIADGSKNSIDFDLSKFSKGNELIYLHLPLKFNERLRIASNLINRKYAVHSSDDDFLLHSGLVKCIEVLSLDSKIVACSGQTLKFNPYKSNNKVDYGNGYDTLGYKVESNSIAERLNRALSNYKPVTFYAVMKRNTFIDTWGSIENSNIAMVQEFEQIISTFAHGNVTTISELSRLWSVEVPSVEDPTQNRKIKFENWWIDKEFEIERGLFIKRMVSVIAKSNFLSESKAHEILIYAINLYLANPLDFNPMPRGIKKVLKYVLFKLLKKIIPGEKILIIKRIRLRILSLLINRINPLFNKLPYGSIENLHINKNLLPLKLDECTFSDLTLIEKTISDFKNVIFTKSSNKLCKKMN